jgi:hypothetical protein
MLLTRAEMTHDFGAARLVLPRDRELLRFVMSQFLYGEVTGIQVGHWLYHAPDLEAARFFAKQSVEELTHVVHIQRIFDLLGATAEPPHPAIRFLATGFMGGTFAEHVALEMAQGEGFVLMVFYALIDLIEDPAINRILRSAVIQEEQHVGFGEERTMRAVAADPRLRSHLLGLNLVSLIVMRQFARRVVPRVADREHPVLRQLPEFLAHTTAVTELRLVRLGLLDRPLAELGRARQAGLVARALARRALSPLRRRPRLLTDTYLADPLLNGSRGPGSSSDPRAGSGTPR